MHGTKVEHLIQLAMKMDTKILTLQVVECSWPLKCTFHMVYQTVGNYKTSMICFAFHISKDMWMFGCPQNWDASPGEHNLIVLQSNQQGGHRNNNLGFWIRLQNVCMKHPVFGNTLHMISSNIVNMKDEDLSITPLKNNDNIKSELVRHHFATILNGITLTLEYKKQHHARIVISNLHAIVIHWFWNELNNINLNLFGKSIIKIYS